MRFSDTSRLAGAYAPTTAFQPMVTPITTKAPAFTLARSLIRMLPSHGAHVMASIPYVVGPDILSCNQPVGELESSQLQQSEFLADPKRRLEHRAFVLCGQPPVDLECPHAQGIAPVAERKPACGIWRLLPPGRPDRRSGGPGVTLARRSADRTAALNTTTSLCARRVHVCSLGGHPPPSAR